MSASGRSGSGDRSHAMSATTPGRDAWGGPSAPCFSVPSRFFSLLVGLGTWLVGSPVPSWVPSRPAWVGALIVLGLALSPLWYRLGSFSDRNNLVGRGHATDPEAASAIAERVGRTEHNARRGPARWHKLFEPRSCNRIQKGTVNLTSPGQNEAS